MTDREESWELSIPSPTASESAGYDNRIRNFSTDLLRVACSLTMPLTPAIRASVYVTMAGWETVQSVIMRCDSALKSGDPQVLHQDWRPDANGTIQL